MTLGGFCASGVIYGSDQVQERRGTLVIYEGAGVNRTGPLWNE